MHVPRSVHFPVNGYFSCFRLGAVMSEAAMCILHSSLCGCSNDSWVSTWCRLHTCGGNAGGSPLLHILASLGGLRRGSSGPLLQAHGGTSCGFTLHFPGDCGRPAVFSLLIVQSHTFHFELSVPIFARFKLDYLSFLLICRGHWHNLNLCQVCVLRTFSPRLGLAFSLS